MNLQNKTDKLGFFTIIALLIFGFCMVLSDIYAPFTTSAYLQKNVISVSSEVKGVVDTIFVENGQYIKKDEPVFSVDEKDLIQERDIAFANKVVIEQHLQGLRVDIGIEKTKIAHKQEVVDNTKKHYSRYVDLFNKRTISQEQLDDAKLAFLDARKALKEQVLSLKSKQAQLGEDGENGGLMLADALLNKSENKVSKAVTYAPVSGWITNLQLNVGESININAPKVAITSDDEVNIVANFNEKALPSLTDAKVLIVFDALPGEVFWGRIESIDSAVQLNQHTDNDIGREAFVHRDDRWIRKSQQVRTVIHLDEEAGFLISGSKATVMVIPDNSLLWRSFSKVLMQFISLFRYIY